MEAERELLHLRCAPETLAHRCFDHRRTHDIYSNAASRVFERGGLRQPHHAMLASAIRGCPSGANPTCDGGHVDDGSTTALLEHLLNFVLQAKPDALRLMSMVRFQSSSDCSAMGLQLPSIPALLNATSKRPNFSTVFRTRARTSAARDTSVFTNRPSPPAARTRSSVSFPSDSRRPATTTLAPAFAKSTAVSRPIPDVPPVTIPILPCNSAVMISPCESGF